MSGENEIKYDKAKMIPFMGNFDKDKQHMSSVGWEVPSRHEALEA